MGLATTPVTMAAGHFVTAADWNTEVRDNMNALGAGTIMATPTTTASSGTATSGSTETRDAVLGNYVFTAVAGRRYLAVCSGFGVSGGVGDLYTVRIRDGGASTPTSSSPLVASFQVIGQGTGGTTQFTIGPIQGTFVPGAGTQTLSVFAIRAAGSAGNLTPVQTRELYVVDLGPA